MAAIAPPRENEQPAPAPKGLGTGPRPPGSFTDHLFRWIALASGLLVLVDPRADRVHHHQERVAVVPRRGLRDLRRQLGPGQGPVRRRRDDLRHLPRRHHRAGARGADQHRHRAVRHRDRAPSGFASRSSTPSTCSPRSRRWCTACGRSSCSPARWPTSTAASRRPRRASRSSAPSPPTRAPPGSSFMTAGIIVAIMITPIITSLTREVFATTPQPLKEAAYGMGATRWEMIRGSVFPHSRGGVVVRGHDRPRPRHRRDDRRGAAHRQLAAHQRAHLRARRHAGQHHRQPVR